MGQEHQKPLCAGYRKDFDKKKGFREKWSGGTKAQDRHNDRDEKDIASGQEHQEVDRSWEQLALRQHKSRASHGDQVKIGWDSLSKYMDQRQMTRLDNISVDKSREKKMCYKVVVKQKRKRSYPQIWIYLSFTAISRKGGANCCFYWALGLINFFLSLYNILMHSIYPLHPPKNTCIYSTKKQAAER